MYAKTNQEISEIQLNLNIDITGDQRNAVRCVYGPQKHSKSVNKDHQRGPLAMKINCI